MPPVNFNPIRSLQTIIKTHCHISPFIPKETKQFIKTDNSLLTAHDLIEIDKIPYNFTQTNFMEKCTPNSLDVGKNKGWILSPIEHHRNNYTNKL
jgi:hypothetical protein